MKQFNLISLKAKLCSHYGRTSHGLSPVYSWHLNSFRPLSASCFPPGPWHRLLAGQVPAPASWCRYNVTISVLSHLGHGDKWRAMDCDNIIWGNLCSQNRIHGAACCTLGCHESCQVRQNTLRPLHSDTHPVLSVLKRRDGDWLVTASERNKLMHLMLGAAGMGWLT